MTRFLFLLLLLIGRVASAQIPTSGLIGAWPFSGNANDVSGSANHGTVTGAALVADRCGNANSAYNFTGSEYITMAVPGPTGTAARSICFWAKSTNTVSGSFSSPVVPFDYGGSSSLGGSPFQIVWNYFCQAVGIDTGTHSIARGTTCINNGQWHFFVIAYDPSFGTTLSDAKIYVDAVQQTAMSCFVSGTTQVVNTASNSPVTIGKTAGWAARYFLGSIDDVYLYNRAITATEVSQMYTVTPCSPPVSGSTLVCPGSSYVYSVAPITGATYTWSLPSGFTGTSTTNSISVVAGSNSGSITVVGSSSCGATPFYTLFVTAASAPTVTALSNFPIICTSGTVTLSASGANSYTWQSPSTVSASIVVSPTLTTTYTVRGTNTLTGCTASISITQTVVTTPTVIPSSSGSLTCAGNTATLTATGATSFTWQPGGLTGSFVTVNPTVTTIYTVTGLVPPNCTSTGTVQVLSPPPLSLSIAGSPTACIPTSVTLNATASGGSGVYTYSWTGGPTTSTRVVAEVTSGIYVYSLTVNDSKNCTISQTTSVNFFNNASVTAISSTICPATTGTLSASGVATYTWYPGGGTGSQLLAAPAATSIYTVFGTSAQGCTASAQASLTVKPGVSLSFNTFTITCGNLGSATVSAAGTPGPFTYSWYPTSQTGSVATGLFPGTYTLQVLDASTGCVNTGTTFFAPLVPLTGTVSSTPSLACFGDATGSASISLSGGSGSQTYSWTNNPSNQITAAANNLVGGNHTVTVIDGLTYCSLTHTFFIYQPPALTLNIVPQTPSVCLGGSITYTALNSGGTAGYSYTWATGPAGNVFVALESTPGIYTYTVSSEDNHACMVTSTVSGKFVPNPTVSVNSASICPLVFASLTASGATTYTWNGGFAGNPLVTSPPSTSLYTVTGSALSCTSAAVASIVVLPTPVTSFTSDAPRCNGDILHLSASPTGTAYYWTGPLSFTSSSQFLSIPATPAQSGIYVLKITAANGCTASASNSLTVYPSPGLTVAGSTVCEGQALNLTSNFLQGGTYNWSGPNSHTANVQNPFFPVSDLSMSGTYQATLTSIYGCTSTAFASASVAPMPTVSINAPLNVCQGTTLAVSASGADTYTWFGPGGFHNTLSSFTISPVLVVASGVYTLQVSSGPCLSTNSTTIAVHAAPQITVNLNTPVCQNVYLNLLAGGANSYTWTGSDGFSSFVNPANVLMTAPGMINYTLNAEDVFGCKSTTLLPVYVLPAPVPSVSDGTVCLGGPLTMTAGGGTGYSWSGPNGFSAATAFAFLAAVSPSNEGTYTVTVAGSNSCVSTATILVEIMPYSVPLPAISLSSKAACFNSNFQMTGSGGVSYEWTGPSGLHSFSNPWMLSNVSSSVAGVYTLSVRNASNCVGSSTVQLRVYPQPAGKLLSDELQWCEPVCASLQLVEDTVNIAPVVSTKFLVNSDLVPLRANKFCAQQAGVYLIKAQFTDTNACSNTATLLVTVHPKPNADFLHSPSKAFAGIDEVQFHNNTPDEGNSTWYWFTDLASVDTLKEKDPRHLYEIAGDHIVTLVVKNKWGCADTNIQKITIEDDFNLYVPNAFTPNGDGLNDVFVPKGSGVVKFKMAIYNRWGQQIFESNSLDKAWDGTFKGGECKSEVYTWMITVDDSSGKHRNFTGMVSLLRASPPAGD